MIGSAETFFIDPRYTARKNLDYFDDVAIANDPVVWQPEVYDFAHILVALTGAPTLIDLGCGSAQKLVKSKARTIGVDFGSNIAWCRRTYPERQWVEHDFEGDAPLAIDDVDIAGSVIICADVIEHVLDPDRLLHCVKSLSESALAIFLSTPDRLTTYGYDHPGPPQNRHHVREWALDEFEAMLLAAGLPVFTTGHSKTNSVSPNRSTCLSIIGEERLQAAMAASERTADFLRQVKMLVECLRVRAAA